MDSVTTRLPLVIYRDHLLTATESFVTAQGEALRRFTPYYMGSKRIADSLDTPAERTIVINDGTTRGRLRELLFKITGQAPGAMERLRDIRPVLIHAHFGLDGVLTLPFVRRLGCPQIVTFHGFDATMKDDYARRSFYVHRKYLRQRAQLQREGTLFLAVSGFIRDRLLAQGFPEERTFVHYIGVDTQRFRADPAVERQPIVVFVARLSPEKGCDHLIHAMSIVQAQRPEVSLVVLGDGPERERLETLAEQQRVRARFLGKRPQAEVIAWLNRAQVFAGPSMNVPCGESEGFGLSFAEAQAMGVPALGYAVGGVPEAVSHGYSGLLAQAGDWQRLAQNILQLLANDLLRKQMGATARRRMEQLFDLNRQSEKLEEIYQSVLSRQPLPQALAALEAKEQALLHAPQSSLALH